MRGVTVNDREIVNIIASECFEAFYPALNERMTPSHKATIYKAAKEKALIAKSKAVAVLCPLTEANLGDGVFDMPSFMSQQGVWAIGSDSHIELNPAEELKMLEYSQRLIQQQRNVCCDKNQPHVATWLWLQAMAGGAQASGLDVSGIEQGARAQVVSLTPKDKAIDVSCHESLLGAFVFSDHVEGVNKVL